MTAPNTTPFRLAVTLLTLFALWSLVSLGPGSVVPSPHRVGEVLSEDMASGALTDPLLATFGRVLAALSLGVLVGAAFGGALGLVPGLDPWLESVAAVAQPVSGLTVLTLAVLMFGTDGGAALFAGTVWVGAVIAGKLRLGVRSLDRDLAEMAVSYRVGGARYVRFVLVPQLAPFFAEGARTGLLGVWHVIVLVEFLGASHGIGARLRLGFDGADTARVLSWGLVLVAAVAAVDGGVARPLVQRVARWRHPV
ncbi:MAG: ABC transporter permease subunit [Pseudomonadota bacterium]